MAYEQLDAMGIGFYDQRPVIIECSIQLTAGGRRPHLDKVGDWVFRLLAGRLWLRRPNCIGLRAGLVVVADPGHEGTEIVITRKDI